MAHLIYPFLLTSRVNHHVAMAVIMPTIDVRINGSLCLLSGEWNLGRLEVTLDYMWLKSGSRGLILAPPLTSSVTQKLLVTHTSFLIFKKLNYMISKLASTSKILSVEVHEHKASTSAFHLTTDKMEAESSSYSVRCHSYILELKLMYSNYSACQLQDSYSCELQISPLRSGI